MAFMFSRTTAFNQDLSDFDTAKVLSVSTYLCWTNLTRNPILISYSTQLVVRWLKCSTVQRPSTRTYVISETIGRTLALFLPGCRPALPTCLLAPDALTKVNRQVRMDRGVLQPVNRPRKRALELGNVCAARGDGRSRQYKK